MLEIEGIKFSGVTYVSKDKKGTWIWSAKPVLEDGEYKLSNEDFNKYGICGMARLPGEILHILLGEVNTDKSLKVDLDGVYKITLERL